MTTRAQGHHVETVNAEMRTCNHCGRPVEVGEPLMVSARDPDLLWLPLDCYEVVWATEIERTERMLAAGGEPNE